MASFSVNDLDQYAFDLNELADIPDSVIREMLLAEGEVIRKGQAQTARTMLQGPYYEGGVAGGAMVGKVKRRGNSSTVYVTFEGTQHGNRVAEIAFINEFGKKNQPPRPFIAQANEANASSAVDAAAQVYDKYLKSKGF